MNTEHKRAESLLPWFVNGTLDENELDFVNDHLNRCTDCRRAVAVEIDLARMISAPIETPGPDFESLRDSLRGRLRGARRRRRRVRGWLSGAAVTASVLIAAGLLLTMPLQEPEYEGLTSPANLDSGLVVQVVFAPQTTERELRALLLEGGGKVVEGPSPRGVYRVSLPTEADAAAYAARLAGHPAVRFAEAETP